MLTEKNFNAILFMLKGGAPDQTIIDGYGITPGTLERVKKSNGDYAAYKKLHGEEVMTNNRRNYESRKQAKPAETVVRHEQSVTIVANHFMAEELRNQTKLLELISNKLAYIVEALS